MRFERGARGVVWDGGDARRELVAGNENIMVGSTAAFGGYDVGVIRSCDFVDDADEAFGPADFVVFGVFVGRVGGEKGGLRVFFLFFFFSSFGGVAGGWLGAVFSVGEAGLHVGDSGKVKSHY